MNNLNEYQKEAKIKYSHTNEYQDFVKNHDNNHDLKANQLMEIFKEIGVNRNLPIESEKIQLLIRKLQNFITENYYTCSNEILKNLGQMYVEDSRFKENIDKVAGDGTSEYVNQAIKIYCK